ncbi:MAG: HAD hydrolase-like protein [Bdellovibrionales bacterium]
MIDVYPYLEGKKHVIWDWNGTLLNDLKAVLHALGKISEKLGKEPIDRHTYLSHFKFPVQDFYRDIGFFTTEEEFDQLSEDFHLHYQDFIHTAELYGGTKQILEQVKKMGATQSILTAAFQQHIDRWLVDYEINHLFDFVYGLPDKLAKSKLERGRELMNLAKVDPQQTISLGDTTHDYEVGAELGVQVVLLTNGHQHEDRLKDVHHAVFRRKY